MASAPIINQRIEAVPLEPPVEVKRINTVGRYELYGVMARGGMATVHFGRLCGAEGFVKMVAIKRLHPEYATDPDFVTSFKHEARLTSRIRHPNVVSTLDVLAENGQLYVVMEYMDGEALSNLLRASGQRPIEEVTRIADDVSPPPRSRPRLARSTPRIPMGVACAIVRDMLHGLHAAHEAKDERRRPLHIVHRDISPQNVLVGVDGSARVLDFGIAKAADEVQNTKQGTIKGKIAYMAPEQIFGEDLDRRCDIYATGVILWELLTGRRLFGGSGRAAVGRALHEPIDPPGLINSAIPEELDDVVMRALERERDGRYATAMDFAAALTNAVEAAPRLDVARWVEDTGGHMLESRAAILSRIEGLPMHVADAPPAVATPRKRRRFLILGGATLTATLLGGAFLGISLADDPIVVQAGSRDVAPLLITQGAAARPIPTADPAPSSAPSADASSTIASPTPAPHRPTTMFPTPSTRPKPAPAADCDPPYIVDERGHKKYKRNCF